MSWLTVKISDITETVTKGTTPTTYGMPFTNEGVNFIKAEALNGDSALDYGGFTFISEETHAKLARSILKENDVLVTIAGANVGRCGYVKKQNLPANTNQAVGIVRIDPEKAEPRFVYYYFKHPSMCVQCLNIGGQAAQPNVNLGNLKSFDVLLPDRNVQKRIASILSAYDDLIENNRRRIVLLEEAVRLLYREWFVHFRFPGHEHVKIIDGVPDGWARKAIGHLADVFRGKSYKSTELREKGGKAFANLKCIQRFGGFRTSGLKRFEGDHKEHHRVKWGDIVMAVTDMTRDAMIVAQAGRVPSTVKEEAIYSMDLVKILPKADIPSNWLYALFRYSGFSFDVREHAAGTTVLHLKPKHIESWVCAIPPNTLIQDFASIIDPIINQQDKLELQSAHLVQARDLLLPRLMDGRLEV